MTHRKKFSIFNQASNSHRAAITSRPTGRDSYRYHSLNKMESASRHINTQKLLEVGEEKTNFHLHPYMQRKVKEATKTSEINIL